MRGALVLALLLAASGCLQVADRDAPADASPSSPPTVAPPSSDPTPTSGPPAAPPATGTIEGFVRDSLGPIANATVRVGDLAAVSDAEGAFRLANVPAGPQTLHAKHIASNRSAEKQVDVAKDDVTLAFVTLPDLPATPAPPAPAPVPAGVFDCPDGPVTEPTPTFGRGGDEAPTLAWAALKTGFRAIVAWQSDSASTASLQYSVAGAPYRALTETLPRTSHVFVIDNLPVGKTFCFQAPGAPTHAMRLGNAGTGADDAGVFTTNLVVLANEGSDRAVVQQGLDDFATRLWDGTDGWVRLGNVFVVYDDIEQHNSGWATCYIPGVSTPACHFQYDVIFTLDAHPGGAASTYRDGISDPEQAMWMNWYWQAHPGSSIFSLDDPGAVLTHEMGHYMLGMQDMYAPAGSTNTGDCWDASSTISIMGGNRKATEYDDEVNRCPNEAAIVEDWGGYEPSWTSMVQRYPGIPQRTGPPDPGPEGNGGAYSLRAFSGSPL